MSILQRDNWTTNVDFIISDIYEYDMRRAGLSIIKEKGLLPEEDIKKLESMEKLHANTFPFLQMLHLDLIPLKV